MSEAVNMKVSTDKVGSEMEIFICNKNDWKEMTEKERKDLVHMCLWSDLDISVSEEMYDD
jgi:hypothetical protein